jgi:uncharacterized protein (UPF0332 family)
MAQPPLDGPYDPEAVEDYKQQARRFLSRSEEFLAEGDLHQASEKGWGAAAWMTKAVAVTHDLEYERHEHFSFVLNRMRALTGNDRLLALRSIANELHGNYYRRTRHLDSATIEIDLRAMAELLDILEPLTEPAR